MTGMLRSHDPRRPRSGAILQKLIPRPIASAGPEGRHSRSTSTNRRVSRLDTCFINWSRYTPVDLPVGIAIWPVCKKSWLIVRPVASKTRWRPSATFITHTLSASTIGRVRLPKGTTPRAWRCLSFQLGLGDVIIAEEPLHVQQAPTFTLLGLVPAILPCTSEWIICVT